MIDFSVTDNPFNEFHASAKYVNSSAVAAEVFHVVNRVKVSDATVALRLNNSNLLHSRLHWRPTALLDLKVHRCLLILCCTHINKFDGLSISLRKAFFFGLAFYFKWKHLFVTDNI